MQVQKNSFSISVFVKICISDRHFSKTNYSINFVEQNLQLFFIIIEYYLNL